MRSCRRGGQLRDLEEPQVSDGGLSGAREIEPFERRLLKRKAWFSRYLQFRAGFGVLLIVLGICMLAVAVWLLGNTLGWVETPEIEPMVTGFNGVLVVFLPLAFGGWTLRAGTKFWHHRKPENDDTGCLVG